MDRRSVFVIVIVLIGYGLVQTQQHLETMQSELEHVKQVRSGKNSSYGARETGRSLSSELEKTNAQRSELQTKLDQVTSEIKNIESNMFDAWARSALIRGS